MNILDKIVKDKRQDVDTRKQILPVRDLEKQHVFERETISLLKKLKRSSSGIIAEHKRRSPSRSDININSNIIEISKGYEIAGACGMSVLTNKDYFGGTLEDLLICRKNTNLPLLRKEFIIDEYQIVEAKTWGADVILLIAAILSQSEIKTFSELAKSLDLEVLLEVHNEKELQKSLMPTIDMIGVNNRNLKSFTVDLETSKTLSKDIPEDFMKVSESGINSVEAIKDLQTYGFKGFLIGEQFMKTQDPGKTAMQFIKDLEA